jgi:hypothetical protein
MFINEYRSLAAIKHDSESYRVTFKTELMSNFVGRSYHRSPPFDKSVAAKETDGQGK